LGVNLSSRFGTLGIHGLEVLSEESGLAFGRGWRDGTDGRRDGVLVVFAASVQPTPANLDRLTHEYSFKDELDGTWAVRPLELVRDRGQTVLLLEDPGGEFLRGHLGTPMEAGRFLRIAVGMAAAVGKIHEHGLIHKDIKPANILVNIASGDVRLTGFGIASRLPRERQAPSPPEFIAGTLPYMAPEQTGRMNRSIDSRSDLYSLGVTLYQMLTGVLPFSAHDPMERVHCHIARTPMPPHQRLETIEAMSEVSEGSRDLLISTSKAASDGVLVAVSDSGPGLPQANPERIFNAFFTTKSSGLGMGLSICRSIVEAHGGRLWAKPNQPHGAVFCMMLPSGDAIDDPAGMQPVGCEA
jgi:serine/threonine protein kinase